MNILISEVLIMGQLLAIQQLNSFHTKCNDRLHANNGIWTELDDEGKPFVRVADFISSVTFRGSEVQAVDDINRLYNMDSIAINNLLVARVYMDEPIAGCITDEDGCHYVSTMSLLRTMFDKQIIFKYNPDGRFEFAKVAL